MSDKPTGVSVDDQFLLDFLAKGGKAETPTGTPIDEANLDQFLNEVADKDTTTPKQATLHNTAKKRGQADTSQEDLKQQQREQERIQKLREKENERRYGNVGKAINASKQITEPVIERGRRAADWIGSASTVGGVGLLVIILIFLLFVVVQVDENGNTRIQQLWYMLNGQASLKGRVTLDEQGSTYTEAEQQGAAQAGKLLLDKIQQGADIVDGITSTIGNIGQDINNISPGWSFSSDYRESGL